MAGHLCLGCKRKFDSTRALSTHAGRCVQYKLRMKQLSMQKTSAIAVPIGRSTSSAFGESTITSHSGFSGGTLNQDTFNGHDNILPGSLSQPEVLHDSNSGEMDQNIDSMGGPSGGSLKFKTQPNEFGVFRVYKSGEPSFIPAAVLLNSTVNSPNVSNPLLITSLSSTSEGPFANKSIEDLMSWFYNSGTTKTFSDLDSLVHDVLLRPGFDPHDLHGFSASRAASNLDNFKTADPRKILSADDGWIEASVPLSLPPSDRGSHVAESNAPKYQVPGLFYRKLLEVIKAALCEESAQRFHLSPFEEFWTPAPGSAPERLYSEIFNTDVHIAEFDRVQTKMRAKTDLETVVVPILIWSDSTQLSTFGSASLWPAYMFIGLQSKYERGQPSLFAAHHIAYIPKLDDSIQDFYTQEFGKPATTEVLTFLRRELMHAVWHLMLDDEFDDAQEYGVEIIFPDGIARLMVIMLTLYCADYPEKVLLSGIKYLGEHPCPRCTISKDQIRDLGTKRDFKRREIYRRIDSMDRQNRIEVARKRVYTKGIKINSKAIRDLLADQVPVRNAFGEKFERFGRNFYEIFAPDMLHEFEIGVWKAVLTHLIRILYAAGGDKIQLFNERYRLVPTFGRDTIRKFCNNVSGLKKLAGRDFEDLLQCALPVLEGLLDKKNNDIVMDLVFELATWHALAKLRLATESTLHDLESSTTRLGTILRRFESVTCQDFVTKDLPSEEAARGRRKAALAKKKGELQVSSKGSKGKQKAPPNESTRVRKFALSTIKLHSLGDYPEYIRNYGTTDNYTTRLGESEHRRCKSHYPRVHKGKFTSGIAKHIRRQRILHNLRLQNQTKRPEKRRKMETSKSCEADIDERLPPSKPDQQYQMSNETRHPVILSRWLGDNKDDPALKGFLDQLKDHLLCRILHVDNEGGERVFTDEERLSLVIQGNKIYRHKILRINYTTYDMRRDQDSRNPSTHANIMMLSNDPTHPYWYARILGVYHTIIQHPTLPQPIAMNFLHIRWYGIDPDQRRNYGWKARRLHRIGFIRHDIDETTGLSPAFGFLDPAEVVRGVHLIPAFQSGTTSQDLPPSKVARLHDKDDVDWNFYYINFFVDRDMFMRFRGGGVGHKSTRKATNVFLTDRDPLDLRHSPMTEEASDDEDMDRNVPGPDTIFKRSGNEGTVSDEEDSQEAADEIFDEEYDYDFQFDVDDEQDISDGQAEDDPDNIEGQDLTDLGPEEGLDEEDDAEALGFSDL